MIDIQNITAGLNFEEDFMMPSLFMLSTDNLMDSKVSH